VAAPTVRPAATMAESTVVVRMCFSPRSLKKWSRFEQ
jgi:hypothetical protein